MTSLTRKFTAIIAGMLMASTLVLVEFSDLSGNQVVNAETTFTLDSAATVDFESYPVPATTNYTTEKTYGKFTFTGDIATTSAYKIDNITLGLRIPKNTTTTRVLTIDVTGYDKIVFDLRVGSTGTIVSFGCGRTEYTATRTTRNVEVLVNSDYASPELTVTYFTNAATGSNRDAGFDNFRFYTAD